MRALISSVTRKKQNAQATHLSRNLKIKDVFPYKLKLKVKVKKELNLLCNDTEFTDDIESIFEGKTHRIFTSKDKYTGFITAG